MPGFHTSTRRAPERRVGIDAHRHLELGLGDHRHRVDRHARGVNSVADAFAPGKNPLPVTVSVAELPGATVSGVTESIVGIDTDRT